jgi:hypothetical protein
MPYTDLTVAVKQEVSEFLRDYRAAMADVVRGLRMQNLLLASYNTGVSAIWAKCANTDLIPDNGGLAGANHSMTKADFTPKFLWTTNLLNAIYSDNGGAVATVWPDKETVDSYGVQLAGPTNIG